MDWLKARSIVLSVLGASLAVPVVHADLVSTLQNALVKVIEIGSFSWLPGVESGNMLLMLVRLLVTILVFTIIFAVIQIAPPLTNLFGGDRRNLGIVVSAVLAIISGIFIPLQALGAIGAGWATAVSLILIGAPTVGIIYLVYTLPTQMGNAPGMGGGVSRGTRFIQFALCLLLFWILTAMHHYMGALGGGL